MSITLTKKERSQIRRFIMRTDNTQKTRWLNDQEIYDLAEQLGYFNDDQPTPQDPPKAQTTFDTPTKLIETALDDLPQEPEEPKEDKAPTTPKETKQEPEEPKNVPSVDNDATTKLGNDIAQIIQATLTPQAPQLDEKQIKAIVKAEVTRLQIPKKLEIKLLDTGTKTKVDLAHKHFETILKVLSTQENIMLVGPAGSGKSFVVEQAAKALNLQFYFSGAVASPFELMGYMDATGEYVETAFYKAFTQGGLFCLDELDGCSAEAILRLNAMLAGSEHGDFPNGMQKRHPNFFIAATANTYGLGANRQYVGRNQLDAASLSRFIMLDFDYDNDLERAFTPNKDWCEKVIQYRANAMKHNLRIVITPRASIQGSKLLAAGIPEKQVIEMTITKGLDKAQADKVIYG